MRELLDIPGGSGATYRFRPWPNGAPHEPIGGNYLFVRIDDEQVEVLVIGTTNDLSRAKSTFPKAEKRGATHVFTRLNVTRSTREAEHQDIAAAHPSTKAEARWI